MGAGVVDRPMIARSDGSSSSVRLQNVLMKVPSGDSGFG